MKLRARECCQNLFTIKFHPQNLLHAIGKNIHAIGYKFSLHKMLRHRGQSVSNPHCRPQCVEAEMKEKT